MPLISTDESGTLGWGLTGGGAEGGGSDEIFWENGQSITTNYAISNGKNAGSFGPYRNSKAELQLQLVLVRHGLQYKSVYINL